jgi:uncharacterized membrane protein YsdA (DUF1294 family)
MQQYLWIALAVYNLIVFGAYGWDKLRAKKGWRRTPEKTLLWLAACLGGPGALAGMLIFHHKTRKPKFQWGVGSLVVIQVALGILGFVRGWWG